MKKILLIVFLAAAIGTQAQIRSIPAVTTEAFKAKYPNATNVSWKDNMFAVTAAFEQGGTRYKATYNNKGEWQKTQHSIKQSDLPAAVTDGLKKSKYADWKMGDVTLLELPGDKTQYVVNVVKSDLNKKNLLFSSEGQLLKDSITL